jgi:hypothetical protein
MPFLPDEKTELAKPQEYALASSPPIAGLLKDLFAPGERLRPSDLPRLKIPAGGGQSWEMPQSGEAVKTFEGVIIQRQVYRRYWRDAYGTGETAAPPDCYSEDNRTGIGDPGGSCAVCPMDAFASARPGPDGVPSRAKACKQMTRLFVLLPDGILPHRFDAPPSAFDAVKKYCSVDPLFDISRGKYWEVATTFGLRPAVNAGGIPFSLPTFTAGAKLPPELLKRVEAYRRDIEPYLVEDPIGENEAVDLKGDR